MDKKSPQNQMLLDLQSSLEVMAGASWKKYFIPFSLSKHWLKLTWCPVNGHCTGGAWTHAEIGSESHMWSGSWDEVLIMWQPLTLYPVVPSDHWQVGLDKNIPYHDVLEEGWRVLAASAFWMLRTACQQRQSIVIVGTNLSWEVTSTSLPTGCMVSYHYD